MNLASTIIIMAGGPGSGCNPEAGKCGRTIALYHGTTVAVAHSIAKNGLKPGRSTWEVASSHYHGRGKIYLSKSKQDAHYFGGEASDPGGEKGNIKYGVVRVEVPQEIYNKMQPDPENRQRWLRYKGTIPASMVTHVGIYKPGQGGRDEQLVKMVKGDASTIDQKSIVPADSNKFSSMLDEISQDKKSEIKNYGNNANIAVAFSSKLANRVKALVKMGYLSPSGKTTVGKQYSWARSYDITDAGMKLFKKWGK